MKRAFKSSLAASAALSLGLGFGTNAAAQDSEPVAAAMPIAQAGQTAMAFEQFAPRPGSSLTSLDYKIWDEALRFFVLRMGPSLRLGASRPSAGLGTRRSYGHDSRYRLEGNRIVFSYLEPEIVASISEYRQDLEQIGSQVDIASLGRNEQLAYWTNLHNVAVIEQIALAYPVSQPARLEIGDSGLTLDRAPFITVAGVRMSPHDIRTKIVFPNWRDPRVIYGFFRGDIGGPSIAREAYTGSNIGGRLKESGSEFVNSLRGVEKRGSALMVSEIYEEARPFYFTDWPASLQAHISEYANEEVKGLVARTSTIRPELYERDIADLAGGDREPTYSSITSSGSSIAGDSVQSFRVPLSVARLLGERAQKLNELNQRGERTGTVIVREIILPGDPRAAENEVD